MVAEATEVSLPVHSSKTRNIKYLRRKYAGPYDTVEVLADKGHLILKPRPDCFIELKAASETKFYVKAWEPVDAEFIINNKEQFCILNRQTRMVYRKIRQ